MTIRTKHLFAVSTLALALAFENETGWKKDAEGALVLDGDGNPIFIDDKGAEQAYGAGYINRLKSENVQHRTAAREAQRKLEAFGDMDPAAARAAITKLKDVDFDALVNKGELDNVRTQMREQYEGEIKSRDERINALTTDMNNLALRDAFSRSDVMNNRLAIPRDAAEALFRDRFKVENGKVVAVDTHGNPVINKNGENASVDEALEKFVNDRPDRDQLLRAPGSAGSGSSGAGGGHGGGSTIRRADFDALPPPRQAEIGQKAAAGKITVID